MTAQQVFIGPFGVRAGWRVILFLLVAVAAGMAVSPFSRFAHAGLQRDAAFLIVEGFTLLPVLAATWVLSRMDGRPFSGYGLRRENRFRNLAAGIGSGFAAISLLIGVLLAAGVAEFDTPGLRGAVPIAAWGSYWAIFFVVVGFAEEMVMRGYPLYALAQGIGFWPAAVAISALFGTVHIGNRGESGIGITNAMVAGLVFAYALKWTGSLWWAIGCHIAWDWGQTFFFGVADSGVAARQHLLSVSPVGPAWLSGGTTGPEGSILALPVLLALAVAARFTAPRFEAPELDRRRAPADAPAETPPPASAPSTSPSTYSVDSGDTN